MLSLDAILESKSSHGVGKLEVILILEGFQKRQEFFIVSKNLLLRRELGGGGRTLE
jgi:hypothetical protein